MILETGSVECWGDNSYGQLGIDSSEATGSTPTLNAVTLGVGTGSTATAIAVGEDDVCAVLTSGAVQCWGDNEYGQVGINEITGNYVEIGDNETPASVGPVGTYLGLTATAVTLGSGHACALLNGGLVQCWGYNDEGQLGVGSTTNVGTSSTVPTATKAFVTLPGTGTYGGTATFVAAGGMHTCADVTSDGLLCWGNNSDGELGTGSTTRLGTSPGSAPTGNAPGISPISFGGPSVYSVALGGGTTCVLLSNGNVRCWGLNNNAQLGLGYASSTPNYIGGAANQMPADLTNALIFAPGVTPAPPPLTP